MDSVEMEKRLKFYEDKYGPYVEKRGLHNWKNLFRRPSMNEWIILILLICCVAFAFTAQMNASICQGAIDYWNQAHAPMFGTPVNFSAINNISIIGDLNGQGG